jgi:monoamine oxidase
VSVLVAGAGLAGLVAARDLERRGASVIVIEARDRVGGRVWTIRDGFAEGQHAEAGGDLIEKSHDAVFELAEELGLSPERILRDGFGFYGPDERGRMTEQSMESGFKPMETLLEPLLKDYGYAEQRWDGALARQLARQSVAEWLETHHVASHLRDRFRGLRGLFCADPEDLSLLALVDFFCGGAAPEEMYRLREGNDRLATDLAAALREPPRLRTALERIRHSPAGIVATVDTASGRAELTADFAVVAIPGTLVWSIDFEPALPELQRDAFARLRTGDATKLLLQFDRRFWAASKRPRAFGTGADYGAVWDTSEDQGGTAAILTCLAGGRASRELRAMVQNGGADTVVQQLDWLGEPRRLLASRMISWDDDEWARGGYVYFHPEFDPHLREWLARPNTRIAFAGEHTSIRWQGYMNGAIETGHRAAAEITALHAMADVERTMA